MQEFEPLPQDPAPAEEVWAEPAEEAVVEFEAEAEAEFDGAAEEYAEAPDRKSTRQNSSHAS